MPYGYGPFEEQENWDTVHQLQVGPPPPSVPIGTYDGAPQDHQNLLSQFGGGMAGGAGSQGQPVGSQQSGRKGGGFRGGAGLAIAAPIVAALVGKLSGGSMNMQEALAALGGGFLNQKLTQQKEKRSQTIDQENKMMDLAHKSVQGLDKIAPETLAKFPKLQSLSQKYQDALANDGIVSPKEAAEIVTAYEMAKADMAAAGMEQQQGQRSTQQAADFEQQRKLQQGAKWQNAAEDMPDDAGIPTEDKIGLAKEMEYDERLNALQSKTRQPFQIGDQSLMLTPSEGLPAIRAQETERHNLKLEELREKQSQRASGNQGRQEALASFQSDYAEWEQARQAALATVDDDPQQKAEIINLFRHTMPVKASYITGGPASKIDRKGLDEIVGRYSQPSGGGATTAEAPNKVGKYTFSPGK